MKRILVAVVACFALLLGAGAATPDADFGPGNSSKGPNDGSAKCHPPGQTVDQAWLTSGRRSHTSSVPRPPDERPGPWDLLDARTFTAPNEGLEVASSEAVDRRHVHEPWSRTPTHGMDGCFRYGEVVTSCPVDGH